MRVPGPTACARTPLDIRQLSRADGTLSDELLDRIGRLRIAAWRTKMAIEPGVIEWREPLDEEARHWVILCGDEPAAAARLSIHGAMEEVPDAKTFLDILPEAPAPIASINRCVVHPAHRARGYSSMLDQARMAFARESGCRSVVATVSDHHRAEALQRQGFCYVGEGTRYPGGFLKGDETFVYALLL